MTLKGQMSSPPPGRRTHGRFTPGSCRPAGYLGAIVLSLLPSGLRCFLGFILLRLVGFPVLELSSRSSTSTFCILRPRDEMIGKRGHVGKLKRCPVCFCDGAAVRGISGIERTGIEHQPTYSSQS